MLASLLGSGKGINFIDPTSIKACNNRRIWRHKVFGGLAKRGKPSIGWFFGFKLHLIVNHKGEIVSYSLIEDMYQRSCFRDYLIRESN
ncbi:hypothetical protein KA531_01550 [Candidatus Saccharibacteria bacterium]|nr:hypothetical protein [Candidatus Saccharibacteria bacterium]